MTAQSTAKTQLNLAATAEARRLAEARDGASWRRWGPYLSERQWGTVREDYSEHGNAWEYLPHDHARSRAYRWGEDGIAGFSDDQQHLCLGLALWNERDPILKERLFGLTNSEGNHGEDVKELYYYLDGTPSHSWMRMLYKYPQEAFPYAQLVGENRRRNADEPEFELLDTGVFDDDRYFDVEVTYAKAATDDILMEIVATNRGRDAAALHILPQLWARNIWSWKPGVEKPTLRRTGAAEIVATHPHLPAMRLICDGAPELLFCDNESNTGRLWGQSTPGHFKDGINDFVVHGRRDAVDPGAVGTKVAAHYCMTVSGGAAVRVRLRLRTADACAGFDDFDEILAQRRAEADAFYAALQADVADPDARWVQRQALAGMLWSKQFYYFDIPEWLRGDPLPPPPPAGRQRGRNADWEHLNNADIVSMPDKWEYPWYAAWDLAFHCVALAHVDPDFAKSQLLLLTREWYMHPNGQLPAYEWAFGDVNPPVQAWAAWRVYQTDRDRRGIGDRAFLEAVFHKLMLNFTWWVNRKDAEGRNIFQGGFLGLDNIGIFDRSAPFLSDYGIRAVSKHHEGNPFVFEHQGSRFGIGYVPGESTSNLFGGNSNWRGPIWMPVNYLLIESLRRFHRYYGDDFRVECPVNSGRYLNLDEVADELSRRLSQLFLKDANGRRPVFGDSTRHATDPAFRDHVLFHEYFHGDTGRGIGASHQTGWTGLVALLLTAGSEAARAAPDAPDLAIAAE